jgi:hypothetical protein
VFTDKAIMLSGTVGYIGCSRVACSLHSQAQVTALGPGWHDSVGRSSATQLVVGE